MSKSNIMNNVTRTFGRMGLKLKKHSPEILIVAGVTGVVTSAVMACKATTKINTITENAKQQIDDIHEATARGEVAGTEYTQEDGKKDLAIVYAQTGLEFLKLYGPSLALGAVSIGCIFASNRIIRKRNIALAAAYATVDQGFKEYRGRVIERFGKELDRELKYNIKAKEIEEVSVDEKGNETIVKKTVETVDPNAHSVYAKIYHEGNIGWEKDPEMNRYFLQQTQNWANDRLRAKGHLFLNEVYDMLGFQRTKAGAQVGWIYDEKDPIGDNYVDFGIFDIHNPDKIAFVNGEERSILLDFNVDGVILEYI